MLPPNRRREEAEEAEEAAASLFWVVLAAVLAALACWASSGHCAPPPEPELVALIGDSQAFLLGQPDALPPLVRASRRRFRSFPVPGSSALSWALGRHDAELARLAAAKPALVLVALGSNDAYMGVELIGRERELVARFSRKLARVAPRVVWVGPPKLDRAAAGASAFVAMLDGLGVELVDSRGVELTFWEDRLHPDPAGRVVWARWLWGRVAPP